MAETYKSGEKVKYRLAEAMKECMKKAPVEKITVKEITDCLLYTSLFRIPQNPSIGPLSIHLATRDMLCIIPAFTSFV